MIDSLKFVQEGIECEIVIGIFQWIERPQGLSCLVEGMFVQKRNVAFYDLDIYLQTSNTKTND